jgi:hypothetical protein
VRIGRNGATVQQGGNTMTDSKKPTHRAFVVKQFKDKDGADKSRWLEIGSIWAHRDGKGFDVNLEALPVDGRIVIRLDEPKPAAASTTA